MYPITPKKKGFKHRLNGLRQLTSVESKRIVDITNFDECLEMTPFFKMYGCRDMRTFSSPIHAPD